MSVKPVAWMDEHGCTCNDDEKVVRGPGFDIPLYSAAAPELAEALAYCVEQLGQYVSQERDCEEWIEPQYLQEARRLLARITPK